MRDDERQRIFMFRTNVNEMNVEPIDLGDELRQGVQLRLHFAPVVVCRPIAREFPHRRELHALRLIRDRLPFGPSRGGDAPAEFDEFRFRNIDGEGTDCVAFGRCDDGGPGIGNRNGLGVAGGGQRDDAEGTRAC